MKCKAIKTNRKRLTLDPREKREVIKDREERIVELARRYKQCNNDGHLKPDESQNRCLHCYRSLEYKTPATDSMRMDISDLSEQQIPNCAANFYDLEEIEIGTREKNDFWYGLRMLREEEVTSSSFQSE